MFTKSNLLGTLVGAISSFVLIFVFFGTLMESFWDEHHNELEGLHRENPENFWLYLSYILLGFIVSTLYGKYKKEGHNFMGGFEIGAWVSAFFFFGIFLMNYANMNHYDLTGTLVGAVVGVILFGITGGLIALVYKATSK